MKYCFQPKMNESIQEIYVAIFELFNKPSTTICCCCDERSSCSSVLKLKHFPTTTPTGTVNKSRKVTSFISSAYQIRDDRDSLHIRFLKLIRHWEIAALGGVYFWRMTETKQQNQDMFLIKLIFGLCKQFAIFKCWIINTCLPFAITYGTYVANQVSKPHSWPCYKRRFL